MTCDVNEPSEQWTEAAQSTNSPKVTREIELGAQQGRTAAMLGTILVAAWLTIIACGWVLWRIL